MRRKYKVYYDLGFENGNPAHYWYGGGKWFVPKYDNEGNGINNPAHSNWQHCRTKKAAFKSAISLANLTGQDVLVKQIVFKKGIRFARRYYVRA